MAYGELDHNIPQDKLRVYTFYLDESDGEMTPGQRHALDSALGLLTAAFGPEVNRAFDASVHSAHASRAVSVLAEESLARKASLPST